MKKVQENMIGIILGIIFAVSSAILSIQLIVINYYTMQNIIFTAIISFLCAIYFWFKKKEEIYKFIKTNVKFTVLCAIVVYMIILQLYVTKGMMCKELAKDWIMNPFRVRYFAISLFSALCIGVYVGNKIKEWILDLYHSLDTWDKKAYVIATIISFFVIVIAYSSNANWYLQYDKVYSLDSGWCFKNVFPSATYYDIRHPLLSIFTFPIWAVAHTIVNLIIPGNLSSVVTAIMLQIINAQLLILIGLQIKALTKNKWIFILYMLSFQTILYTVFFEKYQLCTFLVVLYVFTVCHRKENSTASLVSAAGAMPTSCVIGIGELFTKDKFSQKIKKITKIIVVTILTFICLGRGHVLQYGITEMTKQREQFSNKTYTIQEKAISTTKVFEGSVISLPSQVTKNHKYLWEDLESKISIGSITVLVFMVIGSIANRKEIFTKLCIAWSIFAVILFMVLNWSTHETPLFAIYFSWAMIPLFVMGIDKVVEKLKVNPKIVYITITSIITVINICTMFDIQKFLQT